MSTAIESLRYLQKLRLKSGNSTEKTEAADTGGDSFAATWTKIQKEQQEWNDTMRKLDVQQYKISLQDSFWNDNTRHLSFVSNYMMREQQKKNQETLDGLVQNLMLLQQMQVQDMANGTPADATALEAARSAYQEITKTLQMTMMLSMANRSFVGLDNSDFFGSMVMV